MQSTSTAYTAAIAQGEQGPIRRVTVDSMGDITAYVDTVSVEAALTTDLPEEATQVAGYVASKLTIDLTGDPLDNAHDGAWLWSPYNSASPFYGVQRIGANITVELGYETANGEEFLTVFVGRITRLVVDSVERTATLEALDGAERLRHRLDLPMVVGLDPASEMLGGLNSQWVIDAILRSGGFFATPPARPNTLLSATLLGSFGTEIGSLDAAHYVPVVGGAFDFSQTATCPYTQGPFGLAPTPTGLYVAPYTLDPRPAAPLGTSVVMAGWMLATGTTQLVGGSADVGWTVSSDATSQSISVGLLSDPGTHTAAVQVDLFSPSGLTLASVPVPLGWRYIGVQVVFVDSTHVTVRVRVDGTTTTVGPTVVPTMSAVPAWDSAQIDGQQPTQGVLIWQDGSAEPAWDNDFVPTAILDPGLNNLTAIPALSVPDAFEALKDVVGAEAGTFTFTGPGVALFRNRQHWRSSNTAVRTLDTDESVLGLSTVEAAARTRNRIRISVQPLSITAKGIIWQDSGERKVVPARGSLPLWADLGQDMAYQVDTSGTIVPSGGPMTNGQSGYRAARRADGTGGAVSNLTMQITPFVDTVKMEFGNPNGFPAWLVSPTGAGFPSSSDGQPAPVLVGRRITRTPQQLDTNSIDPQTTADAVVEAVLPDLDPADERVYEAPSSPWRQSSEDAQVMADDLLLALYRSMPQVQDLAVIADPSLELGDRVTVKDPGGLKLAEDFWIVGLSTAADSSGMTQSVNLRPVSAPGQWLWGVEGRDIFGVTPW